MASRWHLLVRRELDGTKLKFDLSNAKPEASLRRLAEMQGARRFAEQSFREAKSRLRHGPVSGPPRGTITWPWS